MRCTQCGVLVHIVRAQPSWEALTSLRLVTSWPSCSSSCITLPSPLSSPLSPSPSSMLRRHRHRLLRRYHWQHQAPSTIATHRHSSLSVLFHCPHCPSFPFHSWALPFLSSCTSMYLPPPRSFRFPFAPRLLLCVNPRFLTHRLLLFSIQRHSNKQRNQDEQR